jgi:hypothetical protein
MVGVPFVMAASPYHLAGIAAICPAAYHVFVIPGPPKAEPGIQPLPKFESVWIPGSR